MIYTEGRYININGALKEIHKHINDHKPSSVYEVIRTIDKKPLFLSEHLDRFYTSLDHAGYKNVPDRKKLEADINELIKKNDLEGVNVRVVYTADNNKYDLVMYLIKTRIPQKSEVEKGVKTRTYHAERKDPNIKTAAQSFKDLLNKKDFQGIHELLLVDRNGYVTEGSKSNVFFIKDGKVMTPPLKDVLPGITRKKVIEICEENKIDVEDRLIHINELVGLTGLFITGTSIGVLKVRSVDDFKFDVKDPVIEILANGYEKKVKEDIMSYEALK
ncbi:aminotransferase class IV [Alkalibacter mobilis]|uniref:aminotransferase class IV n=1 Tax=Alkalibacter mobilis TaxID=2787712 RepID=UPI00189DD830|nr:aminotransferase class IV [Alkalibacter mobilis]MBF7096527.1 aminotransferase class IV family protein [Alkalibacter mobilis]